VFACEIQVKKSKVKLTVTIKSESVSTVYPTSSHVINSTLTNWRGD